MGNGRLHDALGYEIRFRGLLKHRVKLAIADLSGHAVTTHEEAVTKTNGNEPKIGSRIGASAEGTRDHVSIGVDAGLVKRNLAAIHEFLHN